jgi:large conductance mechanosensitive channel
MVKEFREFAVKGNVVDMAVGIIIGAAFGTIVQSLVADIIMPPIGMLLGNVDFSNLFVVLKQGVPEGPYATLADAAKAGAVTFRYGQFVNTLVNFTIVAFAIFIMVKQINRLKKSEQALPPPPSQKECPHCFTVISIKATRCPHCTSELKGA